MNASKQLVIRENVVYHDKHPRQKSDIYYCRSYLSSPACILPVIVCIHGGMWLLADKKKAREMSISLALRGFCVVAPSYRLSYPTIVSPLLWSALVPWSTICLLLALLRFSVKFLYLILIPFIMIILLTIQELHLGECDDSFVHPAHLSDIALVCKWVSTNISSYHGNPNDVSLLGHSAGAHLAVMLAIHKAPLEQVGLNRSFIRNVVSISGVFYEDLLSVISVSSFLKCSVYPKLHQTNTTFPKFLLHDGDRVEHSSTRFLFINPAIDLTLEKHTLQLQKTLTEAGIYNKSISVSRNNHYSIRRFWSTENKRVLNAVHAFLLGAYSPTDLSTHCKQGEKKNSFNG
jgi:pimeloyl-ACP methyl ester carboxylesterase